MITLMVAKRSDFSPDKFAVFLSVKELFLDEEAAEVWTSGQGRWRQEAVLINSL